MSISIQGLAAKIARSGPFVLSRNPDLESDVEFATCPNDSSSPQTIFVYYRFGDSLYFRLEEELEKLGIRLQSTNKTCSKPKLFQSARINSRDVVATIEEDYEKFGGKKEYIIINKDYF